MDETPHTYLAGPQGACGWGPSLAPARREREREREREKHVEIEIERNVDFIIVSKFGPTELTSRSLFIHVFTNCWEYRLAHNPTVSIIVV